MQNLFTFFLLLNIIAVKTVAENITFSIPDSKGDMLEYSVLYIPQTGIESDIIQVSIPYDSTDNMGNHYFIQDAISINPIEPPSILFPAQSHFMIDTLNKVYESASGKFPTNEHRLIYDLNASKGNYWIVRGFGAGGEVGQVEDEYEKELFGDTVAFRVISYYSVSDTSDTSIWLHQSSQLIADGFGVVEKWSGEGGTGEAYLKGAIIDGIVYGDTTSLELKPTDYHLPKTLLYPNHPNPFNPVTTIRYELPRFSHVRLSVYDILGKEVALLGDRDKGPGVREVQWDATNVPSGVYFIQMQAGDFRQVRKVMVLK